VIEVQQREHIIVAHIKHGKANTLDTELCTELKAVLDDARAGATKALVLTGEGKIFSAGVDLVRLIKEGDSYRRAFLPALREALHAAFFCPKPLIAAINGHAVAGGCVLACAADHRVMVTGTARIGLPELQVGVPFPPIAVEIMRFATPPQHFSQIMFRGLTSLPEEALTWGLVDELVAPEALLERALARAEELAAMPAKAYHLTKVQVRRPVLERLEQPWTRQTSAEVDAAWNAAGTLEAIRQYVEKKLGK
jgi:enoyl-CoA hydratase